MEAIIKLQQKRLLESKKRSAFRVRKRPVSQGKIDRYKIDHAAELGSAGHDSIIGGDMDSVGKAFASH